MSYAILRLTRTLLYDDHVAAGGGPPEVGSQTGPVEFDYRSRPPSQRPVIRTYQARIAVSSNLPTSWELALGGDYRLLIITRGFESVDDTVTIVGRVTSNYQIQLDPASARIGPNATRLDHWVLRLGDNDAVQVLSEEVTGRSFREYQEIEVEDIVDSAESVDTGIQESTAAQQRRADEWQSVTKSSLS